MDYTFTLWGEEIEFDDEDLSYIRLYLEAEGLAEEACTFIQNIYDNQCSSLRDLERKLFSQIFNILENTYEKYYLKLQENGLYTATREQFDTYVVKYSNNSRQVVQHYQELYNQCLRNRDSSTDVLTYRDPKTKEEILDSLYLDILYMHLAFLDYLHGDKGFHIIPFDHNARKNAFQIYDNLYNRLVPEQFRVDACVEMLETWPLEPGFYQLAVELLGDESGELQRLAEFIGLSINIESSYASEASAALVLGECKLTLDNLLKENVIYRVLKGELEKGLEYVLNASLASLNSSWQKRTFIYSQDSTVLEKFKKAFEKFASLEIGENPLILHDSSLLKSGGSGFLITNKKIHGDVFGKGRIAFPFDEIDSIDASTQYLILNGKYYISIEFLEKDDQDRFIQLIKFYITIIPYLKSSFGSAESQETTVVGSEYPSVADPASIYERVRSEELKKKLFYPNQNEKANSKLQKMVDSYAQLAEDEQIVLGYDDTVFGSAKNGFLLTNNGIHIKSMMQKVIFIPYETIEEIYLKGLSKSLYINNTEISLTQITERHSKEELVHLLSFMAGRE